MEVLIVKRYRTTVVVAVLTLLAVSGTVIAELYTRAPDVLPGTLPEMRTAEYWIQTMDDPDEVILTPARIRAMNRSFQERMKSADPFAGDPEIRAPKLSYWWPGMVTHDVDLKQATPEAAADTVKKRIRTCIDHVRKNPWGNINAIEYADWQIDEFEDEMNLDAVGNRVEVLDGIIVRTSFLRSVPTLTPDKVGMRENAKTRWDLFNSSILKIGRPVQVLHRSKSGEYVFVLYEWGFGWAPSRDIAFSYESKIDGFFNADDFVVCTGDRVPFYSDRTCRFASGYFMMGDRLPLADPGSDRRVLVPVRCMDGEFDTGEAWLAPDADVHVGWLPYTRRNVVTTALKLLDNQYDWTGGWLGRQHETTYRDLFCCFGFELPNHGGLFTFFNRNAEKVLPKDTEREEQYREILSHPPFVTLQSCGGHAQLRLGEYNGVPIVFDQHGYGYEDESGEYYEVRRCNIGVQTMPDYFLKNDITFLELR